MPYPTPINDDRLTPEMRRMRSGPAQLFYLPSNSGNTPDFSIEPPEKHIYAELVDGQWMWVNGCAECNGQPRDWMTYIECDKHNRCRQCEIPRNELTEAPWGGQHGWICKPCADVNHEREKVEALTAMPSDEDFCELDYMHEDEIKCPWCNAKHDSSDMYSAVDSPETIECHTCDNTFKVTGDVSISWTMERVKP